jgi:hypothetical protein
VASGRPDQAWQFRSWQRPTDPRFLEKAIPILDLYARAQSLSQQGHIIVCTDEKTSIEARKAEGGTIPAGRGHALHVGDRYQRRGAVQLFAGLLVHTGETLARCFEHKRFREFQAFLQMLFASLWCKRVRVLHLILDNGSTHAPKQLAAWIRALSLPFDIRLHWLPVHASWLDQIEIIFSVLQRKVLMPNDFAPWSSRTAVADVPPSATERHSRSTGATPPSNSWPNSADAAGSDWPHPETRNEFMIRCTKVVTAAVSDRVNLRSSSLKRTATPPRSGARRSAENLQR